MRPHTAARCPPQRRRPEPRLSCRGGSGYFSEETLAAQRIYRAVLRIIRHPGSGSAHPRGAVLAMGNFDGLHLGHAALIKAACARAQGTGKPAGVLTFEPHPRSVFMPQGEPFRLTPFRVKEREIARLGVELLFVQHFDLEFAHRSAEYFVEEVMLGAIGLSHIVVGHDCTFGNRRRGTPELLREMGARHGGRPREAAAQLGRFWEIDGRVMVGDRRGRTIGFPTANLGLGEYLRPAFGVYAVRVSGDGPDDPLGGRTVDGVANIGLRPTVGTPEPRLEAHLFDIDTDLYGRHLRVSLIEFIRPEKKFAGLDELKAQIAADAAKAREILADLSSQASEQER